MGIGVGGLLPGDRPQGAGVQAEVGAPEARGAGVGEVAAQGGEASPKDRLHIRQVCVHNCTRYGFNILYNFSSSEIFKERQGSFKIKG